jgi:hypothetical protein
MAPDIGSDPTAIVESGPFGEADARSTNLDEMHFVAFQGGGLSTPENDHKSRILIGRKGSGKTLYLRRLRRSAADNPSMFALDREAAPPDVAQVMLVYERAGSTAMVKNLWPVIWRRAIVLSVASYLLFDRRLERRVKDGNRQDGHPSPEWLSKREELAATFNQIGVATRTPIDVGPLVTHFISEHGQTGRFDRFLNRLEWQSLEVQMAELLLSLPPLCLYLDNLDDTFQLAPKFWTVCLEGLILCILGLHSDRFANKLHIHATFRESVYSSLLRSAQRVRLMQDRSIRHLAWNANTVLHFLNAKIRSLPSLYVFDKNGQPEDVEAWLQIDTVRNVVRDIDERLDRYILRHTRLLPRDVIIIGNNLARRVEYLRKLGLKELPMADLRSIVSTCARAFADEQLQICAEHLVSHSVPRGAVNRGYADAYMNETAVQAWATDLEDLIVDLKKDRFSRAALERSVAAFAKDGGVEPEIVLNSLWWSGLIGYCETWESEERHVFFTDENILHPDFDKNRETYVLHPSLLDRVNIQSEGKFPVTPS